MRSTAAIAAGVILLAGCRSPAKPAKTPAPPTLAYVRLDALVLRHPLQADVARLRESERGLLALARQESVADAASASAGREAFSLPALPIDRPGSAREDAAARAQNQEAARLRLRTIASGELTAYIREQKLRQESLIDQRRSELMAIYAGREAERERLAREAVDATVRQALAGKMGAVQATEGSLAVLQGQLGAFPAITDATAIEAFDAELAQLEKNPKALGISERARLEFERQRERSTLDALRAEIARIKAEGLQRAEAAAHDVASQHGQEIENALESLRDDAETRFVTREQAGALQQTLTLENGIAARVESLARSTAGGTASVQYGVLFGGGDEAARVMSSGPLAAARRVARQRERLERFLRADTEDAIRDAAQDKNVDVKIAGGTPPAAARDLAGRKDMTSQFVQWVKPFTGAGHLGG